MPILESEVGEASRSRTCWNKCISLAARSPRPVCRYAPAKAVVRFLQTRSQVNRRLVFTRGFLVAAILIQSPELQMGLGQARIERNGTPQQCLNAGGVGGAICGIFTQKTQSIRIRGFRIVRRKVQKTLQSSLNSFAFRSGDSCAGSDQQPDRLRMLF